ncbi:hypothetical protein K470DRAFT_168824 [Piedraia hortae CBS 480.64]|uniref:Uncharacterized protein n=1 Tax=Piedraia hortae CBS 480.64 TaxID=1314780 RepID=A0A6A7BS37_9PEZI|nr:hypothetical protein K470DRAFT_168824 [Piedraia hortae CBS 480.64]
MEAPHAILFLDSMPLALAQPALIRFSRKARETVSARRLCWQRRSLFLPVHPNEATPGAELNVAQPAPPLSLPVGGRGGLLAGPFASATAGKEPRGLLPPKPGHPAEGSQGQKKNEKDDRQDVGPAGDVALKQSCGSFFVLVVGKHVMVKMKKPIRIPPLCVLCRTSTTYDASC